MSDTTSAEIFKNAEAFISAHLKSYLGSGGSQGHILDVRTAGGSFFTTHCLLKTVGRKSGKSYITPLCYGAIGGEVAIIASKAGADHHPAWYLNLAGSKEVDFQVATQAYRANWREPEGEEREQIWAFMEKGFPAFATYKTSTDRTIPIIMLIPKEEIAVFSETDMH